jgi:hypothetical protein
MNKITTQKKELTSSEKKYSIDLEINGKRKKYQVIVTHLHKKQTKYLRYYSMDLIRLTTSEKKIVINYFEKQFIK